MAKIGDHAVVLGASMAGLLAARSLSEFFDAVTVVERDPLPDTAAARRGVPQGRHLHGLLPRGAQVFEELFPGILDRLVLDGAHYLDGRDLSRVYYDMGGHLMGNGSAAAFSAYLATRPFLEEHVFARVRSIPNVALLDEHDVVELTATPEHDRVTGVRVVNRRTREDITLSADLVVDATGRAARTPTWLERLGYDADRGSRPGAPVLREPVPAHGTGRAARTRFRRRSRTGPPHELACSAARTTLGCSPCSA